MAQPASRQEDDVRRIVGPVVDDADLYLEEVRVTRAGSRSVVRITLDLPETRIGSLDSDTLGEVSREVSAALDDGDVVAGAYTLEISTPGTSRALTTARHFRRARTRLVVLTLAIGIGGTTAIFGAVHGVLDGVGRQRHRRGDVEPAAAGLCQPRTCIGNDDSFTHLKDLPLIRSSMEWSRARG
jgi:ribosome maturation factor RimP